jgi:hypothetical protein
MSVTIDGMEEVFRTLTRVAAIDKLEAPMQRSVLRLEAYMKDYPPPPLNSSYRRTGSLGRRWITDIERRNDGLIGRVGNNIHYARWVQSRMYQQRIFERIGWRTETQAIRANETAIRDDFQTAVNAAVRG